MKKNSLIAFLFLGFFSPTLQASQKAEIVASQASLLEAPNTSSRVIEFLNRGTQITIGNTSRGGYYKVRSTSGQIGFIEQHAVRVIFSPTPYPIIAALDDEPIGSGDASLEACTAWSDDLGLSAGGSVFFRVRKGEGGTFEAGVQGLYYLFNVAKPLELDGSLRYWLGRKGIEAGFELFNGYTLFTSSDFANFARSFSFGPGIFASTRLSRGNRIYLGLREDFHAEHHRYLLAGIALYF